MKKKKIKARTPTVKKAEAVRKGTSEYRKKLYRKRTIEEVGRRFNYTVNDAVDGQNNDVASQTVDAAVDTTRYAAGRTSEAVKAYSRKLRDRPGNEEKKHSDALRSDTYRAEPEKTHIGAQKAQKDRIKKNYAKTAREAQKGAGSAGRQTGKTGKKAAEEAKDYVSDLLKKAAEYISEHPIGTIIAILALLILLAITAFTNTFGMVFGGVSGGSLSATYTAEDVDIYNAELYYAAKEAELQEKLNYPASLYPGYDEYVFDTDAMFHDPWNLTSILTVLYEDFNSNAVKGTIDSLFDAQYVLSTSETTEIRYRTEPRTGYIGVAKYDDEGNQIGITYQAYTDYVQVPYEYHILTISLRNNGLDNVIYGLGLDSEKMELYEYMNTTHGERDYLF